VRVLVACEYSGRVRDAFRARGHDAYSCDLLPSEADPKWHYQCDMWELLSAYMGPRQWDLVIAHPECTYHTNASVRWFTTIPKKPRAGVYYGEQRWTKWAEAVEFFKRIQALKVPRLAIENPIMHGYSYEEVGRPTQIIQPWQFGHKEMKATCLWLRGLPPLKPTRVVGPPPKDVDERRGWAVCHQTSPGPDRWKDRSRTYSGIAKAMAAQWG
jgi:hypothetical protein